MTEIEQLKISLQAVGFDMGQIFVITLPQRRIQILKKSAFPDMMAGEGVEESGGRLDYRGKMILAPMVKVILL